VGTNPSVGAPGSAGREPLTDVRAEDQAGEESAFTTTVERHRRELQVHCYRMLGSLEESEDLVQETFLRAWRGRESFEGRSSFRAWLYRIATNACLDALAQRRRVLDVAPAADPAAATLPSASDFPWLEPYPDHLLEGIAASDEDPDAVVPVLLGEGKRLFDHLGGVRDLERTRVVESPDGITHLRFRVKK
jgi:RNA polymerase sigma-70 factor (ECF subfamily)